MKHGAPIEIGHHLLNDALVIAVMEKEVYACVLGMLPRNRKMPYATWEYRLDRRGATYSGHYFEDIFEAVEDYAARVKRLT